MHIYVRLTPRHVKLWFNVALHNNYIFHTGTHTQGMLCRVTRTRLVAMVTHHLPNGVWTVVVQRRRKGHWDGTKVYTWRVDTEETLLSTSQRGRFTLSLFSSLVSHREKFSGGGPSASRSVTPTSRDVRVHACTHTFVNKASRGTSKYDGPLVAAVMCM